MKNKEFIFKASDEELEKEGAWYEIVVNYFIQCPYVRGDDQHAHCNDTDHLTRKMCFECKDEWLNMEVE